MFVGGGDVLVGDTAVGCGVSVIPGLGREVLVANLVGSRVGYQVAEGIHTFVDVDVGSDGINVGVAVANGSSISSTGSFVMVTVGSSSAGVPSTVGVKCRF